MHASTQAARPARAAIAYWREAIALFIYRQEQDRSLVWFRLAFADFESPDVQLCAFQDTIVRQDQPVLESLTPERLPPDLRVELRTSADRSLVGLSALSPAAGDHLCEPAPVRIFRAHRGERCRAQPGCR